MGRALLSAWSGRLVALVIAPLLVVAMSVGVAMAARDLDRAASRDTAVPVAAEVEKARTLPHTTTVSEDAALASLGTPIVDGLDVDCATVKCVAITFDDGPGAQTGTLLDMLDRYAAVATWFPVGEVVADSPERLRAIARAGHEIGNHSWSHPQLTTLDDDAVDTQITSAAREIERTVGTRPSLVRPPYGSISPRVTADPGRLGDPVILWDVDPLDWKYRNADTVYANVMRQVGPWSIVLLHDVHPTTVAAVPRILSALAERGYVFVTVSELFGGELRPGKVYTERS